MNDNIPFYPVDEPYELFYKNGLTPYPVGAHTHNAAEIYLTLTDLPDVLLNDTVSLVPKGSLILIPPFCIHQLYHEKNISYERYILNIDTEWLKYVLQTKQEIIDYLDYANQPHILILSENNRNSLIESMNALLSSSETKIENVVKFFSLLSEINSMLLTEKKDLSIYPKIISKTQKTVNDIIAYINERIDEKITLSEIEEHFYLNRDYISRLFMKHAHISLGRYIIIQRISKAQYYLREGLSVQEVTEKMGYSSYAYFFKIFKKMTGISPSQYQNSINS